MAAREYGQFCGLARALETVGERWTLLIVRNLLSGPQRYTDLRTGLPAIPTNILSARLKTLEDTGLVVRRALPRPERAVVYELTEHGRDLEPTLIALGRWGARTMGEPRPGEVVTPESVAMAFRTSFRPEAARGFTAGYEVRMGFTLRVQVSEGALTVGTGPHPAPDLVVERRAEDALRRLLTGATTPDQALAEGGVRVTGDPALLHRFVELFRL
ncbi:winged helix-turn-helix transcriptional regulator [Streptomonospora sp. S1-112]|uniref:Winged helix-turn-helix transcriptional regulator n=1 Tax=Streptomonospora mangrovi TaxID=2883123 RepID=A0A9X3SDX4_9ACTN|nr:winged helix-turn-helix transcriptional regulator [Streptomonospora mangrovi]MDA0563160.1 winged helix-turn-helix transcriptional regulator [Streptomonospora mangrovi]